MIDMSAVRHLQNDDDTNLREDEAVCKVTNYTYLAALKRSPHVDEKGRWT